MGKTGLPFRSTPAVGSPFGPPEPPLGPPEPPLGPPEPPLGPPEPPLGPPEPPLGPPKPPLGPFPGLDLPEDEAAASADAMPKAARRRSLGPDGALIFKELVPPPLLGPAVSEFASSARGSKRPNLGVK